MLPFFEPLRQFNFLDVTVRLLTAFLCAGIIGYGRSHRGCQAGLRTYILIGLGATLTILITLYEYKMLHTVWIDAVQIAGEKFDASRLASQALTGIGFLGAGTILKAAHQQVNGLTTATGLFTTVCMSVAAGAGFYECVFISVIFIIFVLNLMAPMEILFKRRLRNITLNIEMESTDNIAEIQKAITLQNASVYDIDIESGPSPASAIFILQLSRENSSHSGMLSSVAELDCVRSVQELIA